MELPSYFSDFLKEIRPTGPQKQDMRDGHKTLRDRLHGDPDLSKIIVSTFLQGSYRRSTAIRPSGESRSDVDVVVVTKLSESDHPLPKQALDRFVPFLEKYYKGKWGPQGRSFGIKLTYVELDLVPTSAPSEAEEGLYKTASVERADSLEEEEDWQLSKSWVPLLERADAAGRLLKAAAEPEWKTKPLRIPDRDTKTWEDTHPLAQIQWTRDKNARCGKRYLDVVKIVKWWRRLSLPDLKYPKGYPVEHIVGTCCPDTDVAVATLFVRTLEDISTRFASYAALKQTPFLADHGVPANNVLRRVTGDDFATFHAAAKATSKKARAALDEPDLTKSANAWRELLGEKFPKPPEDASSSGGSSGKGGFTPRSGVTIVSDSRWA